MVHRLSIVLAATFAFCWSLAGPAPASAAEKYLMTCEIGTGGSVLVDQGSDLATATFSRSKGPTAAGLQSGECAFDDRAVLANEPAVLCFGGTINRITFRRDTATSADFGGDGGNGARLLVSAIYGPAKLMTFTVRPWNIPALGGACFQIVTYNP